MDYKSEGENKASYLAVDVYREAWDRFGIQTDAVFHTRPGERMTSKQRADTLSMYEQLSKLHLGGSSDDE